MFNTYTSWIREIMMGGVNWMKTPIYLMIVDHRYDPNLQDKFQSQVYEHEVYGEGYQAGGVRLQGMSISEENNKTIFSADPIHFPSVTWNSARYGVLYASISEPAKSPLIGVFDLQSVKNFVADTEKGSLALTAIANTQGIAIGYDVRGPGIPPATIVVDVDKHALVMSRKAKKNGEQMSITASPLVSMTGGSYQIVWSKSGIFACSAL